MWRLGLCLAGVVIWASEQLPNPRKTAADYVRAAVAHVALAGVSMVGWLVDRLPRRIGNGSLAIGCPASTGSPTGGFASRAPTEHGDSEARRDRRWQVG